MLRMKVLTVVGARPQFVKAAVVSRSLRKLAEERIVHTGQHYDPGMSDVFFEEMSIPRPDWNLGVGGLHHSLATAKMLEGLAQILADYQPDFLLVYGDTTSTLAGALAGVQHRIPVVHVEAGMRSGDMQMPEEVNRVLTDRLATFLFCPTQHALQNLKDEGFDTRPNHHLSVVGDVMFDATLFYLPSARPPAATLPDRFNLCTFHRAALLRDSVALRETVTALTTIAGRCPVVLPLHPHTAKVLQEQGIDLATSGITVIPPTSYFETLWLLQRTDMVLTDSGGLQREAYFLGKPCVTLRDETEWVELPQSGRNLLAGNTTAGILEAYEKMEVMAQNPIPPADALFGDGNAAERIVIELITKG